MHTEPLIWTCGIVTLLPHIPASGCQQGLQLEGQYWWQGVEGMWCGGWAEGTITNLACHMVKQGRFTTDRVPHQQHGVVALECQVWEWDQTPALVCTPFLATAAGVTGWRWQCRQWQAWLVQGPLLGLALTSSWVCKAAVWTCRHDKII